jgi:ubiquinone/menaquinone biosynthesis C-methylase UbiE
VSALPRVLEPEFMDSEDEASSYDAMDHSEPNRAFVARLAELGADGRMLDLGTGPGHIPMLVLERFPGARVVAVDAARAMLAYAERRRLRSPHRNRVTFALGDVKRLNYPDRCFDAVLSNTVMHHLADPAPYLREAARVKKRRGALLIRDLFRPRDEIELERLVALYAADADDLQRQLFRQSLHAAFTPEEFRALADANGLAHAELAIDSDRHMSLQIRAVPRREPVELDDLLADEDD